MQEKVNNRYRQYTLSVPGEVSDEIKRVAKENGVQEIDVLRQGLKLILLADKGVLHSADGGEIMLFGEKAAVA